MPTILITNEFHPATVAALERDYTCHRQWEAADPLALLNDVAAGIDIVATSSAKGLSNEMMDRLPQLKLIACFGVGLDTIDVAYARAKGIAVSNTPDVLTEDVADLALLLALATVRQVIAADRFVRDGDWLKGRRALTASLQGKRVGIIGLGAIGKAIARRFAACNAQIAWSGPRPKPDVAYPYYASAVELASQVDILVAACPGGAATRGIVSREVLAALGPAGFFVNIARGSVVDEHALVEALRDGVIAGAGLDVFSAEPEVPAALFEMTNVVLQPHVASATHETRAAMGQLVLDNIAAMVAGRPLLTPA